MSLNLFEFTHNLVCDIYGKNIMDKRNSLIINLTIHNFGSIKERKVASEWTLEFKFVENGLVFLPIYSKFMLGRMVDHTREINLREKSSFLV